MLRSRVNNLLRYKVIHDEAKISRNKQRIEGEEASPRCPQVPTALPATVNKDKH